MSNLEEHLKHMQFNYANTFEQQIMKQVALKSIEMWPKISWLVSGIAASVLLCLSFVYLQDGTISIDSILGINILNSSNYNDILTYYQS